MGSQADPELVVTSRAACYNTQKRPGGIAHHAEEIGDHGAGADPCRIPTAAGRRPGAGRHTAAAPAGNPLRHGYPGQRAAIHHRGGDAERRGGNRPEGQDQNHSAAHEALPQAIEIRQKVRHRPRADIPDEKGKRAVPEIHLGGDEEAVRGGEGGAEQGNALLADGISNAPMAAYADLLNVTGSGIMGYIDIPSLGINLPICHGTDAETLEQTIAHVMGTSLPVGGESTHAVLSAHSGLSVTRLFSDTQQRGMCFFSMYWIRRWPTR